MWQNAAQVLDNEAIANAWPRWESLAAATVRRYARPGTIEADYEALLSHAREQFVIACRTYNGSRPFMVYFLILLRRAACNATKRVPRAQWIVEGLSPSGRTHARMGCNSPEEVEAAMSQMRARGYAPRVFAPRLKRMPPGMMIRLDGTDGMDRRCELILERRAMHGHRHQGAASSEVESLLSDKLTSDDLRAMARLLWEGHRQREVQRALGIGRHAFDSRLRRIRQALAPEFPHLNTARLRRPPWALSY